MRGWTVSGNECTGNGGLEVGVLNQNPVSSSAPDMLCASQMRRALPVLI